jgi:hypothetical protein
MVVQRLPLEPIYGMKNFCPEASPTACTLPEQHIYVMKKVVPETTACTWPE